MLSPRTGRAMILARWYESYPGPCPKCGGQLNEPDDQAERLCPVCELTIGASEVTLEDYT